MRVAAGVSTFALFAFAFVTPLVAQQPTTQAPNTAEQGKPAAKPATPPVQRAPRTRADTARALREPLDTVKVAGEALDKPVEQLSLEAGPPWRMSYFPYITGTGGDIMLAARVRRWQPAEIEDRVTYRGALTLDAGYGIHGSWLASARFDAPLLTPNLRTSIVAQTTRETRFGFYGLGNNSEFDKGQIDETQPNLFRVRRMRYLAYGEVTRRLVGHLHIAGRVGGELARFEPLDGPSAFGSAYGAALRENDANARIALVFDSRNNEFNARNGLLLEAGFQAGSGGDSYTRYYTVLRGYAPLRASTVVAARFGASNLHGTPSLDARYELPTWDVATPVYGGYQSNRGYPSGRFVGSGVVFGSLELRQDFLPFGEIAAGSLVAFLDAGRVFEEDTFTFNAKELHVAGGIGVAARLLRSTIFTLNLARSSEEWKISAGSGWAF